MGHFAEFFKSPWGNLCIGIVSSIMGALLFLICDKVVRKTSHRIKRKRLIKNLVKIGESYNDGYTTSYARNKSPFHQMLHIGNHEIGIMMGIAKVLFSAITGIAFLVLFQDYLIARPIIIAITSLIVAFYYKGLRRKLDSYGIMFDYTFGDDYKKHMMEGLEKHWDSIVKNDSSEKMKKEV